MITARSSDKQTVRLASFLSWVGCPFLLDGNTGDWDYEDERHLTQKGG